MIFSQLHRFLVQAKGAVREDELERQYKKLRAKWDPTQGTLAAQRCIILHYTHPSVQSAPSWANW